MRILHPDQQLAAQQVLPLLFLLLLPSHAAVPLLVCKAGAVLHVAAPRACCMERSRDAAQGRRQPRSGLLGG